MVYNSSPLCANASLPLYHNFTFLANPSSSNQLQFIRYVLSILFFLLSLIHVASSLGLFMILHYNDQATRIRVRSPVLVFITALAVVVHSFIAFIPGFYSPLPSALLIPCVFFLVPLTIAPVPIRLFNFYGRYVFSRAITQISIFEAVEVDSINTKKSDLKIGNYTSNSSRVHQADISPKSDMLQVTGEGSPKRSTSPRKVSLIEGGELSSKFNSFRVDSIQSTNSAPSAAAAAEAVAFVSSNTKSMGDNRNRVISSRELLFLRFIASPFSQLVAFVIGLIPLIAAAIATFMLNSSLDPSAGCFGVPMPEMNTIIIVVYGLGAIFLGIIGALLVRGFTDPFGIATETRLFSLYGGSIVLFSFIFDSFLGDSVPISFTFDYTLSIGLNIMLFASTDYQIYLAVIEHYSKYSFANLMLMVKKSMSHPKEASNEIASSVVIDIDNDPSKSPAKDVYSPKQLVELLNNPKEAADFEKFLIAEFSGEMMRVYIECKKWEDTYYDSTESQRRARAKKIIELFIQPGSVFEVNIPGNVRMSIVEAIEDKKSPLPKDLFAKSQKEMIGLMYGAFRRYIRRLQSKSIFQ